MLRHIVHDTAAPSTARLETSIGATQHLQSEMDGLQLTIQEQRREIDSACTELVRHREISLQLLERLHALATTINAGGDFCYCTRELAAMLRSSSHQLQGSSLLDYLTNVDRNHFLTLCRECLKTHRDVTFDTHLIVAETGTIKIRLMLTELPGWALAEQSVAAELLVVFTMPRPAENDSGVDTVRRDPGDATPTAERHDTIPAPPENASPSGARAANSDSIGWFAGGVAHEFNNVLTAVTCNISMALMELADDAPASSFLKDAANAVNQASVLTRQLLEFSRRRPTTPELARIDTLVEASRLTLDQVVGERIAIRTAHQSDAGVVHVDPSQFEMVLVSLVRNARDALIGGGTVSIETNNVVLANKYASSRPALSPGSYVAMRVIDNGCGMCKETLDRLFEPFFTTKPHGQGTGLGLATSLTAVRQSGGGIEVNSALGKGTAVTVYWPRVLDADRAPMTVRVRMTPDGGPETILLVEDESALRTIGVRILGRLGYRVLSASNGIEALEVASRHPGRIDLLFTDIVMPGMNGRDLAIRLKKARPDLRVLFTSGYTERIFDEEAQNGRAGYAARRQDYLSKPYLPEALAGRVKEMLRAGRSLPPPVIAEHPK